MDSQYRSDPDLQLLAKDFAWITTWDDHGECLFTCPSNNCFSTGRKLTCSPEVADNGYRDGFSHMNNTEDSFSKDGVLVSVDQRKMNAVRAYFEWMPIRYMQLPTYILNPPSVDQQLTHYTTKTDKST